MQITIWTLKIHISLDILLDVISMFYSVLYQQYDNRCSIFFLFLGRHKGYTHLEKICTSFHYLSQSVFQFFPFSYCLFWIWFKAWNFILHVYYLIIICCEVAQSVNTKHIFICLSIRLALFSNIFCCVWFWLWWSFLIVKK